MARLRQFFLNIWNLRSHPRRFVRLLWWIGALFVLRVIVGSEPLRGISVAVLAIYAMAVSTFASLWGVVHPRLILQVRSLALRWSLVLAIVGTLSVVSLAGAAFSESTNLASPTGAIFLFSLLVILPAFFVFALPVSLYGAALATWSSRNRPDHSGAERRGVNAIWWAIGAIFLLAQFLENLRPPEEVTIALVFLIPVFTLVWSRKQNQEDFNLKFQALLAGMERRLVYKKRRRNGTIRTFDLRGAALGVFSACVVLFVTWLGILVGLRMPLLASLIQLRNTTSRYMLNPSSDFSLAFLRSQQQMRGQINAIHVARRKIVLLQMDSSTLYNAQQENSSETATQAHIIRALKSHKAALIILPMPVLKSRVSVLDYRLHDTLPINSKTIEHSRRDLLQLNRAVKNAANVALIYPEEASENAASATTIQKVVEGARYQCRFGIGSYGTAKLCVISTENAVGMLPVPLTALSVVSMLPEDKSMMKEALSDQVVISGRRIPLIAPNRIVIDFQDAQPGHDFARVSYRDVLENRPAFMPTTDKEPGSEGAGRWLKPKDYLRDKIVILDTFAPFTRETPVGNMASNELLAYSTAMLLSGEYLGRVNNGAMVILTLLLAAGIGHWCVRKPPLHAGWRFAVACVVIAALCIFMIIEGIWFDPVVPIAACLGTFLLVTQFTFGMEQRVRTEHRRLLDRLVAPEFLEELMEDPEGKLGLQGRRQWLCVLFADVRGFTRFAEENSPEKVVEIINAYMSPITQSLLENGGILDKYTGDGLMALFRIGDSPHDSVIKAVHATLAMKNAADAVSARLHKEGKDVLGIGFGLHYGEAVVGLVGMPPDKVNYTALGHTVVISQRLQTLALGGEIIISEEVFVMLGNTFEVTEGDPVTVKGITIPVRPYRVLSSNAPPDENEMM